MLFSSAAPLFDHISNSSVTVRWPSAWNFTSGEGTYLYSVIIRADGWSHVDVLTHPHTSNTDTFELHITGLDFNTYYSVRVKPLHQSDDFIKFGRSTGISRFKTLCIGTFYHNHRTTYNLSLYS
ncbi:hypothetical protein NP493_578g03003 [Ridgeia piscesae]|uniref:Fibronectin type-III domain-containing protein n=1 Tax=Ridgeia piscesae TaxID=27915 RepID=A0AAD9NSG8_RIDPI|nr:hypothetical protein NP493_578g03003 [Ridgeia piscesae]